MSTIHTIRINAQEPGTLAQSGLAVNAVQMFMDQMSTDDRQKWIDGNLTLSLHDENGVLIGSRTNRKIIGVYTKRDEGGSPVGTTEFDATGSILTLPYAELMTIKDSRSPMRNSSGEHACPILDQIGNAHVNWHQGHDVHMVDSICQFFGVHKIEQITPKALDWAKSEFHIERDLSPENMIIGKYNKQQWGGRKGDDLIDIDTQDFDATSYVLRMPHEKLVELQDFDYSTDEIGNAHVKWDGPHSVRIVEEICNFFRVHALEDISPFALDLAKNKWAEAHPNDETNDESQPGQSTPSQPRFLFEDGDKHLLSLARSESPDGTPPIAPLMNLFCAAWAIMTPQMRSEFLKSPAVAQTMNDSVPSLELVTEADQIDDELYERALDFWGLDTSFQYSENDVIDIVNAFAIHPQNLGEDQQNAPRQKG